MAQLQTNLARRSKILRFLRTKLGTFYEGFASLPTVKPGSNEPSENTLELQNLECSDSCSWTSETDDYNVPNALSLYLDPRLSLCTQKKSDDCKC